MSLDGFRRVIYTLLFIALPLTAAVGAPSAGSLSAVPNAFSDDANTGKTAATPPIFTDTFNICLGDFIYDTLLYACHNVTTPEVTFIIYEGAGDLQTSIVPSEDSIYGYYRYLPDTAGIYYVTYLLVDGNKDSLFYYHEYVVNQNQPPTIEDQYFSGGWCVPNQQRLLEVAANDAESDALNFVLISGPGTINDETGVLSYSPATTGRIEFLVAVYDDCGGDTAYVYDDITLNNPPKVFCYEKNFYQCSPEEICFVVRAVDPDGDPLTITMLEGFGTLEMFTDTSAKVCFMPEDVDTAVYRFVFNADDGCSISGDKDGTTCSDTTWITVIMNRPPELSCPDTLKFNGCDGGNHCFDIEAIDPEGGALSYQVLSGNATIEGSTVCFTSETAGIFDITIAAYDSCGVGDTCTVSVETNVNHPPYITAAPDFSVTLCQPEMICFTANVDDPDYNLQGTYVNYGTYDTQTHRVCFTPDTAGIYDIRIFAVDSCGLSDTSTTLVTVDLNEMPQISLGQDTSVVLCGPQEICIAPAIVDDNLVRVSTNISYYNAETGSICFSPDTSGTYVLTAEVFDDCDRTSVDTVVISVVIGEGGAFVELGDNQQLELCAPEDVCIDVATNVPFENLHANYGQINTIEGKICFTPDSSGVYLIIVEAADTCSGSAVDSVTITVDLNAGPTIFDFNDSTFYLCYPQMICLPVTISDADGNVTNITVNRGSYADGQVCFVPYDKGNYTVIVTATDDCGRQSVDTAIVTIATDQTVNVIVPKDTVIFSCELDTFCFPIYGIPANGTVSVTGVNTWFDPQTQTVCYYSECSNKNKITVTVTTPCNTFVKQFNVTVNCNSAPLVILPPDTSFVFCEASEICIPVGISDPDHNLSEVSVEGGTYNPQTSRICFNPDTSGAYRLVVTAEDDCGETDTDEILVSVEVNQPPVCLTSVDTTMVMCAPQQISIPLSTFDPDGNLVECEIVDGPGTLVDNQWLYNAVASDSIFVTIRCTDECGAVCESVIHIVIDMNEAPVCQIPADTLISICSPYQIKLPVHGFDPEGEPVFCSVVEGPGQIVDSFWVYTPTTSGTYDVTIRCEDACGLFCENTFTIAFETNGKPICLLPNDTTITLCEATTIQLPVSATDDGNNAVCSVVDGPGSIVDGYWVYTPNGSENVTVTVRCTDECNSYCEGSFTVTFEVNEPPVISCPPEQLFSGCLETEFCLDVEVSDPNNDLLGLRILSGNATIQEGGICVTGSESDTFVVVIEVTDKCGAVDTCEVSVIIDGNRPPVVVAPESLEGSFCGPDSICFEISAADPDGNLTTILTDFGSYNPGTGLVCLEVDTAGTYRVVTYATDACDAGSSDTTFVIVILNEPPRVELGGDFSVSLCEAAEICVDAFVADVNLANVVASLGVYDAETGQVCFTPDTAGVYTIVLTASDECEVSSSDTILVTVLLDEGPFVNLGNDTSLFICEPTEICIDVQTITNYSTLTITGPANYFPETGQICFFPEKSGTIVLGVQVTDSCGLSASDEVTFNVALNSLPEVSQLRDTTVYLCQPENICLPFAATDTEGDISISVNRGNYDNGQICFIPYDSGLYQIIATVSDDCGQMLVDTAIVHVVTDQGLNIVVPKDTTIFVCDLDTICFPISGVPSNGVVTVSGINTWYNAAEGTVCFYPECDLTNRIRVYVTTPCGTYSKTFTVGIVCNSAPLVIMPPDDTITVCGPQEICVPVGISDVDHNIVAITPEGGQYDPITSRVCLTVDSAGMYVLRLTAADSCGDTDSDEMVIVVKENVAPVISYSEPDTAAVFCDDGQFCFEVDIADPDNNLWRIQTSSGSYNISTGLLCFDPDTSGRYCFTVTAADSCGLSTVADVCIKVTVGGYVTLECPDFISVDSLCGPGQVCFSLGVSSTGPYQISSSIGSVIDGVLCFNADTAGLYAVTVTAEGECNSTSCSFAVPVVMKEPVTVSCPAGITDTLLCAADTFCFSYEVSSLAENVTVSSPAYLSEGQVCVPVLQAGIISVTLIASNECGADTCSFSIASRFNSKPIVTAQDTTLTSCALTTVCVPFTVGDIDANVVSVTSSSGTVQNNTVCFTPAQFGLNTVIITATDECGLFGADTVRVTVNQGASTAIICPEQQFATLCGPDTVCITVPITPFNAEVTILDNGQPANGYYDFQNGRVCIYVTAGGIRTITVIADALCSSDTCVFTLNASVATPPAVTCPSSIDTTLCLAEPTELCFPTQVTGTGVTVTVLPSGSYTAGFVCVPVTQAGNSVVTIIASSLCGADTCQTNISIGGDSAPQLYLPEMLTFERCPGDTAQICIDGIYATDSDSIYSLAQVCGPASYQSVTNDSGEVCFLPSAFGLYTFCFEAYDGCQTVTDTFYVEVLEKADCDVCVRVEIDGGGPTPVGVIKDVYLNVASNSTIGGFDLLLSYDPTVVAFYSASITGTAIEGWEYFTYNLGSTGCGSLCPPGLVRLVAIADVNNGAQHPPVGTLSPDGRLVHLRFQVSNNQNLGDQFLPITFYWYDCGDNSFSSTSGSELMIDSRIYNFEGTLIWDETNDVSYPESARLLGLGAADVCLEGASSAPVRCVEFQNGGIRVIHPSEIDDRGDLNLNGISYEISDAVLYSNYFIYGLGVFSINLAGQIAASDVNADGLTLSVADLVMLIRIVTGDSDPVPKLNPYSEELLLATRNVEGRLTVSSEAVSDIGAAHFVYEVDEAQIREVRLAPDAAGMDLMYDVVDGQLRILVYSFGKVRIPAGKHELVEIVNEGNENLNLVKAEIVDYQGRPYLVAGKSGLLPRGFVLEQNYPNPFNPTTTIEMTLPAASEWTLTIYNINGYLVKQFSGQSESGVVSLEWDGSNADGSQVASGVYLYRLNAADFTDAKKMVLLK